MDEKLGKRPAGGADDTLTVRLNAAARRVIELMESRGMDVSREVCDMITAFGLDAGWMEDDGEEVREAGSDF